MSAAKKQAGRSSRLAPGLALDGRGRPCCWWCAGDADYIAYHHTEWGFPVADDRRLFEKLCLEGFQAGLSWPTILRKRENFRKSFRDFDFEAIARFGKRDVERRLKDAGIVRHRGKIESVINNARRTIEVIEEVGSFASLVWSHEPSAASRPKTLDYDTVRTIARTPESEALSKDLKRRGFSFVGPTTLYAFMQSLGIVNDHLEGCAIRKRAEQARRGFRRPGCVGR